MDNAEKLTPLRDHYLQFFRGHECSEWTWERGPMIKLAPSFRVLRFAPGTRTGLWSYISLGASLLSQPNTKRLEFVLMTEESTPRAVELVTMVAHYHHDLSLGMFHSMPIGEPWLDGATCDHFLISLPYPFGEELEVFEHGGQTVQTLWLLPITKAELEFKKTNGVDALEELFEKTVIEYWRIDRESAV
jgi:hypothetical protein